MTRFFDASEQRQAEVLSSMLTEDGALILAFSLQGGLELFKHHVGRDAVDEFFADCFALFGTIKLDPTDIFVSDDGVIVFDGALGAHAMAATRSCYRSRYVYKFMSRDGQVEEFAEFFDPITLARSMGSSID